MTEGKNMLLLGKVSFCRFGSLGFGDFAGNSASKMHRRLDLHVVGDSFCTLAAKIHAQV